MKSGMRLDNDGLLNNFAIEPPMYVSTEDAGKSGFNAYSELLNGRLAMIGFVSLIALEAITGHGIIGFLANL